MKYKINIIIVILGLFFFNSCNDDQIITVPDKMEVDNGLKSFENYDELYEELETVNNLTIDELIDYEDAQDFNSFGKISDLLYFEFLEDSTATFSEVLEFIKLHPKYVELVIESDTSFVPTYETSLRYIMNDDRMFKVQDTLFKVFNSGIVSTLYENYDELLHLEDKDLNNLDEGYYFAPYSNSKYGNQVIFQNTVGNERIRIVFGYVVINYQLVMGGVFESFKLESLVRPFHKFTFYWHYAKRTISTNYSFTFRFNGLNNQYYSDYINGSSPSLNRYRLYEYGTQFVTSYMNSIFYSFSGTVSQPNVTVTL